MCGIFGYWDRRQQALGDDALRGMAQALLHRGPDDEGIHHRPQRGVAIGNRRLSIIDLGGGHQPFVSDDGQIDDGQAPVAQGYSAARLVVDAFVVRATVEQRLCHAAQGVIAQWLLLAIPVAKDAAHGGCSQFAPWPPRRRSVHQQIFRSSQSEASRV